MLPGRPNPHKMAQRQNSKAIKAARTHGGMIGDGSSGNGGASGWVGAGSSEYHSHGGPSSYPPPTASATDYPTSHSQGGYSGPQQPPQQPQHYGHGQQQQQQQQQQVPASQSYGANNNGNYPSPNGYHYANGHGNGNGNGSGNASRYPYGTAGNVHQNVSGRSWFTNVILAFSFVAILAVVLLNGNGEGSDQTALSQATTDSIGNKALITPAWSLGDAAGGNDNNDGTAASDSFTKLRMAAIPPRDGTVRIFHAVGDARISGVDALGIQRLAAMLHDESQEATDDNADGEKSHPLEFRAYDPRARRSFLETYGHLCYDTSGSAIANAGTARGNAVVRRYDELADHPSLQLDLWKGCMLYLGHGNAYVDAVDLSLVQTFRDVFMEDKKNGGLQGNFAIQIDPGAAAEADEAERRSSNKDGSKTPLPLMVHPSLLVIPQPLSSVPLGIVRLLVETPNKILESSPLLVPREMRRLIDVENTGWTIFLSHCARLADPSVTVRSLWEGVKLDDGVEGEEPALGSIAEQVGPGTDAAISGESYGTVRLYPNRHEGLHVQSDSESSLVHSSVTPDANSRRVSRHCAHPSGGMCCEVYSPSDHRDAKLSSLLMLIRHPVSGKAAERKVPTSGMEPKSDLLTLNDGDDRTPLPYLSDLGQVSTVNDVTYTVSRNEAAYMATVREVLLTDLALEENGFTPIPTPNFFDILLENDCLPTSKACQSCLKRVRDGRGHDCKSCAKECGCYCKVLCKIRPPEKTVVKEYKIFPPSVRKDGERLVPRIVHQTWYEPVTKEKYPNMSRLIESWKRSGWEYHFWDDDTMASFLSTHFPPEVREAFDAVIPGAFKADLFRYCVLLIQGGVYADMDVLLESNLDAVVSNDVGFMVPMDSPGTKIGRRSCLWNGLMAVAPGHPFLAKSIELVVNNIRNRFTSVDYDDMLCPNPVFQISHSVDTLFTCGPCILGGALNNVLGKHMQEPFEPGDIDIWATERLEQNGAAGDGKVAELAEMKKKEGIVVNPDDQRLLIPGRTIILQQNKEDMGAHRFTWAEKNLMVAATDMPDYDDRPPTLVHYSKTHGKAGVYGVKKLYVDSVKADEKIRLVVQPM